MTQIGGQAEARTVNVPGATLYVEVRGSGPVLLCISGGPTDAGTFTDLAERLADSYTVVSYDQRGHSRSALDGEPTDIPVALHADDAAAILKTVGGQPAYVTAIVAAVPSASNSSRDTPSSLARSSRTKRPSLRSCLTRRGGAPSIRPSPRLTARTGSSPRWRSSAR
jgi:alpha/beta hydrolase fold